MKRRLKKQRASARSRSGAFGRDSRVRTKYEGETGSPRPVGLRAYLGSRWTGYTGPGGEQVQGRGGYLQWRNSFTGIQRKSQKRPDFNYNGLRDLNPLNLPNNPNFLQVYNGLKLWLSVPRGMWDRGNSARIDFTQAWPVIKGTLSVPAWG